MCGVVGLVLLTLGCSTRRALQIHQAAGHADTLSMLDRALEGRETVEPLRARRLRDGDLEFRLWRYISSRWISGVSLHRDRRGCTLQFIRIEHCQPWVCRNIASDARLLAAHTATAHWKDCLLVPPGELTAQEWVYGREVFLVYTTESDRSQDLSALWQAIGAELVHTLWTPAQRINDESSKTLDRIVISEIVHAIEWRQGQTYRAAILSENDGAESECRLDRILNFMHHELGQLAPLALHSLDIRDPAQAAVDCADASDRQPSGEGD